MAKKTEVTSEDLKSTTELLRRVFPHDTKYSDEYLPWFYRDCPTGTVMAFHTDDANGQRVGHYALVPQEFHSSSRRLKMGVSVDTAVDPQARLKGLFVELATATYDLAKQSGFDGAYGAANANSTPGCIKRLGFHLCFSLPVTVIPRTPGRKNTSRSFSYSGDTEQLRRCIDSIDFSAGPRLSQRWDPDLLGWRLRNPAGRYSIHETKTAVAVSTDYKLKGLRGAVILKVFPKLGSGSESLRVREVVNAICRFHGTAFAVYAGFNARFNMRAIPVPRRLLPSPLNLVLLDLTGGDLTCKRFDLETIEFLDFDQY